MSLGTRCVGSKQVYGDVGRGVVKVYVSCGMDTAKALEEEMGRGAGLLSVFSDQAYRRSSFVFAGDLKKLQVAAIELVQRAFEKISLTEHVCKHPRIGVVDNICFSPLVGDGLDGCALAARNVAKQIPAAVSTKVKTVVYGYGTVTLAQVRRHTPYFSRSALSGDLDIQADRLGQLEQCASFGPEFVVPNVGYCCVGAVPYVTSFNVPLDSDDLALARKLASRIRSRSGGLAAVEAVGLCRGDGGVEVACNLLDLSVTNTVEVQKQLETLSGLVLQGYVVGPSWEEILFETNKNLLYSKSNNSSL
mmetsp:Transcript_13293/g.21715  ORF Transcript_13293/g.21715 Transcript_13293/m.21715 type:complete len:305 (+) Transcript_13293:459-1373(+)|eukprot:CAMPEP_0203766754 /NCGR_PEP_ID=MMETSP0099_2-20121227/600_1 /ASSEMBLY_ACC=CAM_ASM_000209 /TAXON_ID=96639 /ORGANISM=" , Strain NY0313808BC1" /LENGTH=304 /DNA_ID=CAMNT_0050663153 /DNA_START=478 /DNA_END=1392 /DNA_ORIENTATION=+